MKYRLHGKILVLDASEFEPFIINHLNQQFKKKISGNMRIDEAEKLIRDEKYSVLVTDPKEYFDKSVPFFRRYRNILDSAREGQSNIIIYSSLEQHIIEEGLEIPIGMNDRYVKKDYGNVNFKELTKKVSELIDYSLEKEILMLDGTRGAKTNAQKIHSELGKTVKLTRHIELADAFISANRDRYELFLTNPLMCYGQDEKYLKEYKNLLQKVRQKLRTSVILHTPASQEVITGQIGLEYNVHYDGYINSKNNNF